MGSKPCIEESCTSTGCDKVKMKLLAKGDQTENDREWVGVGNLDITTILDHTWNTESNEEIEQTENTKCFTINAIIIKTLLFDQTC